jgi:D-lyxose ketol-isomerase
VYGLENGLTLSGRGPELESALARSYGQIATWGLAMPSVDPLVLDFGLGQFDHFGLIEFWIANEFEAGYCGKYLFLFEGQQCPAHRHHIKHETFFLVRGCLSVILEGQLMTLRPGEVLPIPTGQVHCFRGEENSLLLELSMPCDIRDNCFEDPRIMKWLEESQ